ncbi:MAG: polysaccharide biosynthesis/export family protein, partial [Algiphilus sp.]
TVFTLDVGKLEGFLIADRFRLQPRDVVYVAATGFAKYNRVIQQILPTVSTLFQLERLVDTD